MESRNILRVSPARLRGLGGSESISEPMVDAPAVVMPIIAPSGIAGENADISYTVRGIRGKMTLPFEFTIASPPVSQQTRRQDRLRQWTRDVASAAQRFWDGSAPTAGSIMVSVIYFSHGRPFDLDNIPKPILDALKGLVYGDDNQVTDLICRKRNLNDEMEILTDLASLDRSLSSQIEFLHIVVENAPQQEVVSWYRTRLLPKGS